MTGKITIEQKWHQQSQATKKEAEKLPHGKERDALVRKARQLRTASQINEWLSSPGPRQTSETIQLVLTVKAETF